MMPTIQVRIRRPGHESTRVLCELPTYADPNDLLASLTEFGYRDSIVSVDLSEFTGRYVAARTATAIGHAVHFEISAAVETPYY